MNTMIVNLPKSGQNLAEKNNRKIETQIRYQSILLNRGRVVDVAEFSEARILRSIPNPENPRLNLGKAGAWFNVKEIFSRIRAAKIKIFGVEIKKSDGSTIFLTKSDLRYFFVLNQK